MKRVLLSLVLIGGVIGSANALSFIKWIGTPTGHSASSKGHVDAMYGYSAGDWSHSGYTGVISAQYGIGATAGSASYGSTFATFCITPNNALGSGGNPWQVNPTLFVGGNSVYTAGNTTSMFDAMARLIADSSWITAVTNSDAATAFQLVLWELEQTAGGQAFSITNFGNVATQTYYNTFKAVALDSSKKGNMWIFVPDPNNQSQVLVTRDGGGGGNFTPTPEPFTMGLGIAAAAAFARRRIKAKKLA